MTIPDIMYLVMFLCVLALVVIIWKQAEVIVNRNKVLDSRDKEIQRLENHLTSDKYTINLLYKGIDDKERECDILAKEIIAKQKEIDSLLVKLAGHVTKIPKPWTDKGT